MLSILAAPPIYAQTVSSTGMDDWPVWGGDPGGQKYSSLDEIHRGNVTELELAWSWETGEEPIPGPRLPVPGQAVRPGNFQATPLAIEYYSTRRS